MASDKKQSGNQVPVLKWSLRYLQIMGAYRVRKNILSYFTLISIFVLLSCILLETILTWEGIQTLKKVTYFPAFSVGWVKAVVMIITANKIFKIVEMLEQFWGVHNVDDETAKQIAKIFKIISMITAMYMIFGYCLCIGLIVICLSEPNTLQFSNLAPCNLESLYCWIPLYLWQSYCLMFQLVPAALGFDILFMIFTAYVYVACLIFNEVLLKLNTNNATRRKILLRQIIYQHNTIMTFVNVMNDLCSIVMLIQFWCSLWSLTLFPFMMIADGIPKPEDAIFYALIYLVVLFQIYMYGYGGAVIEEQVKSLASSIFEIHWYGSGRTQMRKDLAFMIFRAQNTKVLSAGKMSNLNITLFISTVKNALSVFTLIWQFSNETRNKALQKVE